MVHKMSEDIAQMGRKKKLSKITFRDDACRLQVPLKRLYKRSAKYNPTPIQELQEIGFLLSDLQADILKNPELIAGDLSLVNHILIARYNDQFKIQNNKL